MGQLLSIPLPAGPSLRLNKICRNVGGVNRTLALVFCVCGLC
jgi:hypothetical protein